MPDPKETETDPPETDEPPTPTEKAATEQSDEPERDPEPEPEPDSDPEPEPEQSKEAKITNGISEFSLEPLQDMLACQLCTGYFREPYTITKCLHTFCKSCLFFTIGRGHYNCPTCETYMGKDIAKFSLPDRTMEYLIDKVLFPKLVTEDDEHERLFYQKRGIPLKQEYMEDYEDDSVTYEQEHEQVEVEADDEGQRKRRKHADSDDEGQRKRRKHADSLGHVKFTLIPHVCEPKSSLSMPPLERPHIETQGRIRIGQLKTYIQQQLHVASSSNRESTGTDTKPGNGNIHVNVEKTPLDILCNGVPLGNELSVNFILRTVWMDTTKSLTLAYQYAAS
jgi:hypothetical protein